MRRDANRRLTYYKVRKGKMKKSKPLGTVFSVKNPIRAWLNNPELHVADAANRIISVTDKKDGMRLCRTWGKKYSEIKKYARDYSADLFSTNCTPYSGKVVRVGQKHSWTCKRAWLCPWCWGRAIAPTLVAFSKTLFATACQGAVERLAAGFNFSVAIDQQLKTWQAISDIRAGLSKWLTQCIDVVGGSVIGYPLFFKNTIIARFGAIVVLKHQAAASPSMVRGAATFAAGAYGQSKVTRFEPMFTDQVHLRGAHTVFAYPRKLILETPVDVIYDLTVTRDRAFRLISNFGVMRQSVREQDPPDYVNYQI